MPRVQRPDHANLANGLPNLGLPSRLRHARHARARPRASASASAASRASPRWCASRCSRRYDRATRRPTSAIFRVRHSAPSTSRIWARSIPRLAVRGRDRRGRHVRQRLVPADRRDLLHDDAERPCGRHADRVEPDAGRRPGHLVQSHVRSRARVRTASPDASSDNAAATNGLNACNQRLGKGANGAKTNGFFATGQDDVATPVPVGTSGVDPGFGEPLGFARRGPAVVAHFAGPPYNYVSPNPSPTTRSRRSRSATSPSSAPRTRHPGEGERHVLPARGATTRTARCVDCPSTSTATASATTSTTARRSRTPTRRTTTATAWATCATTARRSSNPRVAANFLSTNQWATLTGGQRDDDHDGYGNKCDANFPGVAGLFVGTGDLTQFRASNGKSRTVRHLRHQRHPALRDLRPGRDRAR